MKKSLFILALLSGMANYAHAQFSSAAEAAYQQSKNALNNSSFSLQNTYARNINENFVFQDGSKFHGIKTTDGGHSGTMTYEDGTSVEGQFNSSWHEQGRCFIKYPDGNWYWGHFNDGEEDGDGSIYCDGEYYDVVFSNGTITSAVLVNKPHYDRDEFDAAKAAHSAEMIRQMQEFEVNTNSSSYSSSSSSRSNNSSRLCGVCYGSGKCNRCGGRGYYTAIGIGSGTHACSSCNRTGRCRSCNGTGHH